MIVIQELKKMVAPFSKRNKFPYKPDHLFTAKMGQLIPFINFEVVPGDTFKVVADNMTRLQALLSPAYAKVNTYTHFFFVPYRLVWKNWEEFITKGEDGNSAPEFPTISFPNGLDVGSLGDHLGYATNEPEIRVNNTVVRPARTVPLTVSALVFRAVALIWNEWYRNQNLQQEVGFSDDDGVDTTTSTDLLYRNWRPDYFTQNLPFQQRGPQVTVPLGNRAPVFAGTINQNLPQTGYAMRFVKQGGGALETGDFDLYVHKSPSVDAALNAAPGFSTTSGSVALQPSNLYADLKQASSASIADWRLAFQIQRLLEKNARGGARYVEWLMSHFGVRCSDARLQRPEYLGGGKSPVMISEVLQTSASTEDTPQGNMAGHGYSVQRSHTFTKSFNEYGVVIGFYSCMPRSLYYQGLPRAALKRTPYDFYLPVLSHLSEQGTYKGELYADGTSRDLEVFGFNPRYEEYRHMYSTVSGQFKTSLDYWQFGRRWNSNNKPELNSDFVKCVPTDAPFAVEDQDNLLVTTTTKIRSLRPIPKYGTPGYIDHD